MGCGYIQPGSSGISEKNAAYFRAEGVRSMDRTEICDVARRTIDNVFRCGK